MHHLIRVHLDVDDLLALHDCELMEHDERAAIRTRLKHYQGREQWEGLEGLSKSISLCAIMGDRAIDLALFRQRYSVPV
jgi:hypothetical protein